MAHSKNKIVKQKENPIGNNIKHTINPEAYYDKSPSWSFNTCDAKHWSLESEEVKKLFWCEILPWLKSMERRTWKEILINSKKQNHHILISQLNKCAIDRLEQLKIEAEAIVSLRLNGTHRMYGHIQNGVFFVLWFDFNHGDNDECVCRSKLKYT